MSDLHDLAQSAALCSPEQLKAVYASLPVPQTPDVRPCADELAPIPAGRRAVENIAGTCAAVAALVLAFIP
ncbi:hypothetical protein [Arenimonas alkanexedens]